MSLRTRLSRMAFAVLQYFRFHWAIHRMTRHGSLQQLMLDEFGRLFADPKFVQIGANDGVLADPLRRHILKNRWHGILVEPLSDIYEQLRANYRDAPGLRFVCAVVSTHDGEATLYRAPPDLDYRARDAVTSLGRDTLQLMVGREPVAESVRSVRFDTLLQEHDLQAVNLVVTDTEGHDFQILSSIDLNRHKPEMLIFEHIYMSAQERAQCLERFQQHHYVCVEEGLDTVCVLTPAGSSDPRVRQLHARMLQLRNRLVPLSDRWPRGERGGVLRQLLGFLHGVAAEITGVRLIRQQSWKEAFDAPDHRPLPSPPSAESTQQLVETNPRLVELRQLYAAVNLPVTQHSRWAGRHALSSMNMQTFRGQTAFIWTYPELARSMQLKYYILANHVHRRAPQLMERMPEDGAFGSVCYDFEQYGRVSRDRLDSALEIDFLDRHLGILKKPDLRVLDIGAGYGRLAHRVSSVADNLADYCCVDAVPESTFFCEYYARHRGLAPKVRVVPLPEVVSASTSLGRFDVAINVHSFSECSHAAIGWWLDRVRDLGIPYLFIVPNDACSFLSSEVDGSKLDFLGRIEAAGYRVKVSEPVFSDADVRALVDIRDHFYLFERV